MRILITGSNGQVGSALRNAKNLYPHGEFLFTTKDTLDIGNQALVEEVILGFKPKIIINTAAYTAVDKAEEDADSCYLINAKALEYLAIASAKLEIPAYIIHLSTDYVYHPTHSNVMDESENTSPKSVYAKSKLQGEKYLTEYYKNHIIIRTSWVYDETGHNFVNTMDRLGSQKNSINVVCDQIGSPTYAGDIADVIYKFIHSILDDSSTFEEHKIFNFSNEGYTNWAEFAREILRLQGHSCIVQSIPTSEYPTPAERPLNSRLDKSLLKGILSYEIPFWKDSLKICLQNKSKI